MSEVISRASASRGRGSARGGRGGFAGRGGRRTNGDKPEHKPDESLGAFDEDGGDIGELRKLYGDKTSVVRELFPDWSEVDVLFALQETNGDESEAVTRIAEGTIAQWGEVSKPKKTARKAKDAPPATSSYDASSAGRPARGGRAVSESRGRGRATERGGRSARGRSAVAAPTNGARKENHQLSIPTEESSAWGSDKPKTDGTEDKENETTHETSDTVAAITEAVKAPVATVKTWASMLRQSAVPKAAPKPKEAPTPQPTSENTETKPETDAPAEKKFEPEAASEPEPAAAEPTEEVTPVAEIATPAEAPKIVEPEVALPPSKDELTETNLEQVVDDSQPAPTGTAASTAADSWDPRQNPSSAVATPLSAAQQQYISRPDASGFATSAAKATAERTTRTPSHHHQRRILDQEEAVRMPGNREVDRTAVQFGAFNLGDGEDDIDGDREEPETRAQPPADSPVAHPRASLPPVAQPAVPEVFPQKSAAVSTPTAALAASATPSAQTPTTSQTTQPTASTQQQYGRFGQTGTQETPSASQKPLDPFNQQSTPSSQPPLDNFSTQTSQPQQPGGAFSSVPSDYSSYYTSAQDRNQYNYYNQFGGQQQGQGQQDGVSSQQRPFGGYGASQADNLSQYPQSGSLHNQPRFGGSAGDAQNSGNSTPNPTTQAQQQQPHQQQSSQGSQPGSHGQQYPGYNHPYYSNPYYHQYYSGYAAQGGFGPYGKGNMYGQPYGVSPNAPYDHSSPAAFGQSSLHRDSGISSGLGDYGRAGSQAGSQPGLAGSGGFGSVHDSFGRGASSFQSQSQGYNSQSQSGNAASSDDLKPFGETKAPSGPSPALGGARPGSATNNAPAAQSGLPPPQNSQMGGYAGYPSHLQGHGAHGSNAYNMGGNAGAGQYGNSPYSSYGQGFGSGGYQGNQQQQHNNQRGWGGNYH